MKLPQALLRCSVEPLIEESNLVREAKQVKSLAYVALPCQMQAVRKAQLMLHRTRQEWPRKVKLVIGLFCAESFPYEELVKVVESKGLSMDRIRKWDIKGKLLGYHEEGVLKISLKEAKKFARSNCRYCTDYTAELADVSIGAVGSAKGWNTVIVRTLRGLKAVRGAIEAGYLEVREPDLEGERGIPLLRKLAKRKLSTAKKNRGKAEEKGMRVMHLETMHERDLKKLEEMTTKEHRIDELLRDVVEPGLCVTCGVCEAVCAESIIKIGEDGMPRKLRDCESTDCGRCYALCPRTTLPADAIEEELFGIRRVSYEARVLGQFIEILSCRAGREAIRKVGQDGGATTALLAYLLDTGEVDAAVSVTQGEKPWYPVSFISTTSGDVLRCAGTIYSTAPTIVAVKRALSQHEDFRRYLNFLRERGLLPELELVERLAKPPLAAETAQVDEEELMARRRKVEAAIERLAKPAVKMMVEQGKAERAVELVVKEGDA